MSSSDHKGAASQSPCADDDEGEVSIVADDNLLEPLKDKILALKTTKSKHGKSVYDETEVDQFLTDDDNLRRFLIARNNDIDLAYQMIQAMLKWRTQYAPSKITIQDFPTAHAQGVWRFAGKAKNGWGIIKVIAANWSSFAYSVDEYCKMVAYYMEQNIQRNGNHTKNFLIFDMKNMSYLSDIRKLRTLMRLLNDYYPERLGKAVIVNCDWVFDKFFNIMIRWVDPRTAAKAIDFRDNGANHLLTCVDADQLPMALGGTREEEWPLELTYR